jgi:hypothetical protein
VKPGEKKKIPKGGLVVTEEEHAQWHKKHGSCGTGKEHDACMKKWGIRIKKK